MSGRWLIIDLSSAPIVGAEDLIEPVKAPSNYKDAAKIADYIAEKTADRQAMVATDLDLARITGAAWLTSTDPNTHCTLAQTEAEEVSLIERLSLMVGAYVSPVTIVTYGGIRFDLPLLMRRARYIGVAPPAINLDRYKSPHRDLLADLCDREWARARSLDFYVRRHQWADLLPKPLTGAEEARVPQTGAWAELEASLRRDVEAIYRLAKWLSVI